VIIFLKKKIKNRKSFFFLAEEVELIKVTAPETVTVETSYKGPHIELPINKKVFESLILAFQRGEVL
jgi:hypothetical protein